jgi:hypothetical protein
MSIAKQTGRVHRNVFRRTNIQQQLETQTLYSPLNSKTLTVHLHGQNRGVHPIAFPDLRHFPDCLANFALTIIFNDLFSYIIIFLSLHLSFLHSHTFIPLLYVSSYIYLFVIFLEHVSTLHCATTALLVHCS